MEFQTRTQIVDAIYHSNSRSELRLDPQRVFLNNVRLGNLGVDGVDGLVYNAISGVYSLIRNIYLMNNNEQIDALFEAHHYLGFNTTVTNENGNNFSLVHHLNGNNNSYGIGDTHQLGDGMSENKIKVLPALKGAVTLNGMLNLQRCFPVLALLPNGLLDTGIFKNLRVVIEWRPVDEWASCFQGPTTTNLVDLQIKRPQLFVDEVLNAPTLPSSYAPIEFLSWELDRAVCPGGTAGDVKQTKVRLNNFKNKFVDKLLLINVKPSDYLSNANNSVKCDGSLAYKKETIQIVKDGMNLIKFNGVDSPARKLGLTCDCMGDLCLPFGSHFQDIDNSDNFMTESVERLIGKMSYLAVWVRDMVTELDVEHTRTVDANNTVSWFLLVLGQVRKVLTVKDGTFSVRYL
jgi:hypothetical protein